MLPPITTACPRCAPIVRISSSCPVDGSRSLQAAAGFGRAAGRRAERGGEQPMSTTSERGVSAPGGAPGQAVASDRWWTLAVVCVAIFMLLLDVTIVNVA